MGNKHGKLSQNVKTPTLMQPDRLIREEQQVKLKKIVLGEFLGRTKEQIDAEFKNLATKRTILENVDTVKSLAIPSIPLIGETFNKLIDVSIFVGKRVLENSNVVLTCLSAFTIISEIFDPISKIDKFYEEIKGSQNVKTTTILENNNIEFEKKYESYKEFREMLDEILADTTVFMMDRATIGKIVETYTTGEYADFYCAHPDKYKLENPTFFETIISSAVQIKTKNKTGGIFSIPSFLLEELNRKLLGLSLKFSIISLDYNNLKHLLPNITHDLTSLEEMEINKVIKIMKEIIADEEEKAAKTREETAENTKNSEESEDETFVGLRNMFYPEGSNTDEGGSRRKKHKSKRHPKHPRKTHESLKKHF